MSARIDFDRQTIVNLFCKENLTIKQIANRLGVSRPCINRNLRRHGFKPLTQSEALKRRYENGEIANTGPAHEAVRGRIRSDEEKIKHAKFWSGQIRSPYERIMYEAIIKLGEKPIPNLAVFTFNVDLGFQDVKLAVEVDGGNWHTSPVKKKYDTKKIAFLKSIGWTVIRFRFDKRDGFDVDAYATEIVSVLKRLRRNPVSV